MNGRFWGPFFWTGSVFGVVMMIFEYVSGTAPFVGLGVAVVQGLLFGATMGTLNASSTVKTWLQGKATVDLDDSETIEATGLANLDGHGGVLYLTNQHLRFASHPFNFGETTWSVPLSEVNEAVPTRTLGSLFPNGLTLAMGPGREKTLSTWERDQWCEAINERG